MRPARIGVSSCIFHADPKRPVFKGKTLLYLEESTACWLQALGAFPVLLPRPHAGWSTRAMLDEVDGLLLQGGVDMAPASYGETPIKPEQAARIEELLKPHDGRFVNGLSKLEGQELAETLAETDIYHSSWAANVETWERSLWHFDRFWILGPGFGARHRIFYESQYLMTLTETGFVGFSAFAWLLMSVLRGISGFWPASASKAETKGMAWGWLLGFVGMLVHNITCISWTLVKIALPFWFLTGVVLSALASEKRSSGTAGAA